MNLASKNAQITILPQTKYLLSLMTILRNSDTSSLSFVNAFEQICAQLVPAALDLLPYEELVVNTPTGASFIGSQLSQPICGVSILRAGASMEAPLRKGCLAPLNFGKILIQRDEESCLPHEIYCKLPRDIVRRVVFVLEPMLATGGSAVKALEVLKRNGVQEENIIFLNLVASKDGIQRVATAFPALRIVTAAVDSSLNADSFISPGLGDFGDRYYGTTE